MGGWLALLLILLAVSAGLYPFVRTDKGALQFLAAALLLALAGYGWQGSPDQPGSPRQAAAAAEVPDDDFAVLRPQLLGRDNRAAYWMTLADADRRRGDPHAAAERLEAAVGNNPRDAALWIGYGYALIAAGGDQPGPASNLAFERAARLAPNHPGPMFFYALALTRGGNLEAAERIWQELLPNVPANSPYRSAIEERIAAVRTAWSTGQALRPAPPLPQAGPPDAAPAAAPAVTAP